MEEQRESIIACEFFWNKRRVLWDQGDVAEGRVLKPKSAYLISILSRFKAKQLRPNFGLGCTLERHRSMQNQLESSPTCLDHLCLLIPAHCGRRLALPMFVDIPAWGRCSAFCTLYQPCSFLCCTLPNCGSSSGIVPPQRVPVGRLRCSQTLLRESFDRHWEQIWANTNASDEAVIDVEQRSVKRITLIIGVTHWHCA